MNIAAMGLKLERRIYTRLRAAADRRLAQHASGQGRKVKPEHLLTGERGEDAAFFYLRERGYTVVARRWTSPRVRGDLDLVARDGNPPMGDTLVIVEVKTRTARDLAPAESAVDRNKQTQLRRLGRLWRRQLPERHRDQVALRFDVLSVYLLEGGAEFEHFPNAFPATAPFRPRHW